MNKKLKYSADALIAALLNLSRRQNVCLLDSSGVGHLGSHLLIAGVAPLETHEIDNRNAAETLKFLDEKLSSDKLFSIFTISYEFGLKLETIAPRPKKLTSFAEPDVFLAVFDCLIVHDYDRRATCLIGNEKKFDEIENLLAAASLQKNQLDDFQSGEKIRAESNFSKNEYLEAVEKIKEHIRRGDTYQTNLTQQIRARLPKDLSPQQIFYRLRKNHPAPFAAFLQRENSTVVSASPERLIKVENEIFRDSQTISASPIKGTRQRGKTAAEDLALQNELLKSEKDRAENVMIVDLLRNDLGRICEFGSVTVEKLCDLETHPTLFHLVSTINGKLCENTRFSDIIKAVYPCGSITGAPKISTMRIIDRLETAARGLSMGAIGYSIQDAGFNTQGSKSGVFSFPFSTFHLTDLSVAIRTMVVRENEAIFNVGGGIIIDSDAENEYAESLLKAKALLDSLHAEI